MRFAAASLLLAGLLLAAGVLHVMRPAGEPHSAATVFRRGNGAEPESLDPHGARSEAALTILRDLYEGLTEIGPDGAAQLAAADRYSVSADGKTYRFHLRGQGRWSNGEAVQAEDFVAAWRRLIDPRNAAQYSQLLSPLEGAAAVSAGSAAPSALGVHALDPTTLEVRLAHPAPYFLALLAHPATFPLNRGMLERHPAGFAKPGVMVSNGAYSLTRWDFGSQVVAHRNHYYWNDAASHIDEVHYYSLPEPAAELRAFRSGAIDASSSIPGAQFAWIREHMGRQLHVSPQLGVYYLGLNLRRPPFAASPGLRQALSMTIDRERLVESVTAAGEMPAYSFVPRTAGYAPALPEWSGWPMARRIARARELLGSGPPPAIELRFNSSELHSRIALAVAHMWKEALGIECSLHAEEFKVLLDDIDRGDVTQVFRASWLADYNDPYSFLQLLQTGFGINLPHYSNGVYDALLASAQDSADAGQRAALLQQAEQVMLADQPVIPLYFYVAKHLVSPQIDGWRDNAMNVVYSKQISKHPTEVTP